MSLVIESNIPLPRTQAYVESVGGSFVVKPPRTLLCRIAEPLPGRFMAEARADAEGPRVSTADLGMPLFVSREDAKLFMPDVCAQFWRRYG